MTSTSYVFLIICVAQFLVIMHLLYRRNGERCEKDLTFTTAQAVNRIAPNPERPANNPSSMRTAEERAERSEKYGAVAATVMLGQPRWFQRRYSFMIQNVLNNVPTDWAVQILHSTDKHTLEGIKINRGLNRLIEQGRIIMTPIPDDLLLAKSRRIELMTDRWIWQNMLAEKVLIFGGTTTICSNSPFRVQDFLRFDYIGAPWGAYHGMGGEGGISVRSRSLMLRVIDYELSKAANEEQRKTAHLKWGQEDHFFVSRIVEMKKRGLLGDEVRIATRNESMQFGAVDRTYNDDVWAVSGTLAGLSFEQRDKFMAQCPEIKIFFPALHDPHCFGASPDSERCAASICALKPKDQRRGGC